VSGPRQCAQRSPALIFLNGLNAELAELCCAVLTDRRPHWHWHTGTGTGNPQRPRGERQSQRAQRPPGISEKAQGHVVVPPPRVFLALRFAGAAGRSNRTGRFLSTLNNFQRVLPKIPCGISHSHPFTTPAHQYINNHHNIPFTTANPKNTNGNSHSRSAADPASS
jgi:hypothetical protein